MNRICDICKEIYSDQWVFRLSDSKESVEFCGHEKCVDLLLKKYKNIKNYDEKSVKMVLKELKIDKKEA